MSVPAPNPFFSLLCRRGSLFQSILSTFCPESKLARAVIAVLFHAGASLAGGRPLVLGALV